MFFSASCWRILSGFASGLSILLIAMMIGTAAACAWLIASSVCGMTLSSAATTRTTMSVIWAPRARMAVKASWPGVSRNVIGVPDGRGHLVGTDVLRDAAGFAGDHVGPPDVVEQRCLAVVDVTHDGDDRRTAHEIFRLVLRLVHDFFLGDIRIELTSKPNSSATS